MFLPGVPRDVGPYSRQLFELTSLEWTPHEIRLACAMNGWPVEPIRWGVPGLRAKLGESFELFFRFRDAQSDAHARMLLYLHWEGNYWRDEEYGDFGSIDFDQAFESSRDTMVQILGLPEIDGSHAVGWARKEPHYHFSIWRGERGLLILQQGELDLACGGRDLSVCLHPWAVDWPTPRMPLLVYGPQSDSRIADPRP